MEVTVKRGRYPALDGIGVHRSTPLDPDDVTVVHGIPVTTVARTV